MNKEELEKAILKFLNNNQLHIELKENCHIARANWNWQKEELSFIQLLKEFQQRK